jgi:hypothetical protein
LEVFFERARGLGCGVVVATQSLDRLPESTRNSLLVNAGTLITFKSRSDEAARLAREMPPLSAHDLQGLDRYEVAARIHTGRVGRGSVVVTGRTQPPPAPTNQGQIIRRLSAERYGRDPRQIEQELRHRLEGQAGQQDSGYGRTGRAA